ncbi:hypothetical protein TWF106_009130 [Orbilia oligospora]|uniref:Uncharacterized protein n=1 Tax=Orbilia oligospora TaxID=2813651 RepID=A0A6G1MBH0_ORBOL|nr:hypothetical protein TWF679_003019 [Orbilia oligospora]KAF3224169.1 hypothetical protein TWF191_006283 [Orbilia oligospora]KAF3227616.1 hypothetical protein TWF106_009130 [Orbilia oligospora]KAF3251112.1 hypothetical protein TWF192_005085 [Orbilia oligospora]
MASPAQLTIGFAHTPDHLLPYSLGLPTASYFIPDLKFLAVGYTSGAIILLETAKDGAHQRLRTYLSGHDSSIVAFESLAVRSPSGKDDITLLSLSLDGRICKWDATDGRCIQSGDGGLDCRPRGLSVIPIPAVNSEGKPLEFNWLTDYYVLVYGCSTSITVLSFTTLSLASLWTGHQDWPILLSIPGASHNTIFTVENGRGLQPWSLVRKHTSTIDISKVQETPLAVGDLKFGNIVEVRLFHDIKEDDEDKVLVVQENGLSVYNCIKSGGIRLEFLTSVDEASILRSATVQAQLVFSVLQDGSISIYDEDLNLLEKISPCQSPRYRAVYYAASETPTGDAQITAFIVKNTGGNSLITGFKSKAASFKWLEEDTTTDANSKHSTASSVFEYNMVYAVRNELNLYTLDRYLLDLSSPNHSMTVSSSCDRVNVLQSIQLPKSSASGERHYLVVGLANGCIYLIEPKKFQISKCLSLHASPIKGAVVLPADLAPRIRSTLLVYSENGSASIIDIIPAVSESSSFKVRTLLTLPSGMASRKLACVATQKGKNLILLVDADGRKRLWDVDSGDGVALANDSDSPKSATFREAQSSEELDSSKEPWREQWLAGSKNGFSQNSSKPIVQDSKVPSSHGYPTATVDIFAILRYLYKKTKGTDKEQVLAPDDDVLVPARSLLTVLVDYLGIYRKGGDLSDKGRLELSQLLIEGYKNKISIAQVDCDGNISIMLRDRSQEQSIEWEKMSPRSRTQLMMSICSLIYTIGHLTTSSETISDGEELLKKTATSILKQVQEGGTGLDLALLCEFWTDSNPWIRESCRILLESELSILKPADIKTVIEYWQDFLPTQISPELFSLRAVLRSVVVLSVIIVSLDISNESGFKIDRSLRRNVALSIELFLTDNDKVYQDLAIDLVSEGWLSWQSEFDAFEVIHILMRILAAPNLAQERITKINSAFIKIAQKNAPLLASGLANCISHGTPEKGTTSNTLTELINLSIAAKKTVVSIVRSDPYLFAEPEIIKVVMDAIVKIIDPQGGQIRDRVLQYVSEVVNEVTDAYPTVAFHRPTQKLAISSSPRAVTIYDLNTAKPVASLEGQSKTAQFLTFSQDGKTIVAADLDDNQLLVWKISVSIFSSFMGAAAGIGIGAEGVGIITAKGKYGFKNSKGVGMLRIEFTGERTVKVTAGPDVTNVSI